MCISFVYYIFTHKYFYISSAFKCQLQVINFPSQSHLHSLSSWIPLEFISRQNFILKKYAILLIYCMHMVVKSEMENLRNLCNMRSVLHKQKSESWYNLLWIKISNFLWGKLNTICKLYYWFHCNRWTTYQIFCIQQILDRKWEYNGSPHELFGYFQKAHD